jgi:L-fuculose-phosphate aldolase
VPADAVLRRQIVETARRLSAARLVAGSVGNVSVRTEDGGALITPTRLPYDLMEPADVVRIGPDGAVLEGRREPSREWPTHLAVHAGRPDVVAIVHSHSPHATAWSFLGEDLGLPTEELEVLGGPVATAPHGQTGSAELAGAVVDALGPRQAVLMARHGVIGVGPDLEAAFSACALVEHQAQIEWILRGRH